MTTYHLTTWIPIVTDLLGAWIALWSYQLQKISASDPHLEKRRIVFESMESATKFTRPMQQDWVIKLNSLESIHTIAQLHCTHSIQLKLDEMIGNCREVLGCLCELEAYKVDRFHEANLLERIHNSQIWFMEQRSLIIKEFRAILN